MRKISKLNIANLIQFIKNLYKRFLSGRSYINASLGSKIYFNLMGLITALVVFILITIMLFVPPYLGLADDGSFYKIMDNVGLSYKQEFNDKEVESQNKVNYYYTKNFDIQENSNIEKQTLNSHIIIVKGAILIDDFFTKDQYFDMRFLAMIYCIFYFPGVWLLVREVCRGIKYFSEMLLISILGMFILSDVSYITYFSSFYPEALWLICLIYIVGIMLSFQEKTHQGWKLIALVFFGIVLALSSQSCSMIGFILVAFILSLSLINKKSVWILNCVAAALIMSLISIISLVGIDSDFTIQSKFNSMTRGVLFQSEDPAEALQKMGINSSYSVLTDLSAFDAFPMVDAESKVLYKGFYDKYSINEIGIYYLLNPGKMILMQNSFINASYNISRPNCGNYEKNVGMPEMGKSLFWSGWSNFKQRSMPKTYGYIIVMLVGTFILWRKPDNFSDQNKDKQKYTIKRNVNIGIILICLVESVFIIIQSGDAEFLRFSLLGSVSIDCATYLILAGLLQKLNLIQDGEKK